MKIKHNKSPSINSGVFLNYLAWIANLGVVPLFLLAAFLFVPAFFFLAALLFFVTLVLETISKLLSIENIIKINQIKALFLPTLDLSVKGIVITLIANITFASASNNNLYESYTLSIGEILKIENKELAKYSISNKDIIKHRYSTQDKELTLKAQKLGNTTITIFDKNSKSRKIEIFIINKTQELKILELKSILSTWGYNSKLIGRYLYLEGALRNKEEFYKIKKFENENDYFKANELEISDKLKAEILTDVYSFLIKSKLKEIHCDFDNIIGLICFSPSSIKVNSELIKKLKDNFGIYLQEVSTQQDKNLKIKFKIIQIEKLDGKSFGIGLDKITGNVGELLNSPLSTILEKNQITINEQNIDISTLAEPKINLVTNSPYSIQIGSDLSYTSYDKEGKITNTNWKFAGLKIKLNIDLQNSHYLIKYDIELSRPINEKDVIDSNSTNGILILNKNTPTSLSEIELLTNSNSTSKLPLFSSVPIIGRLFESKTSTNNYKKLLILAEVIDE